MKKSYLSHVAMFIAISLLTSVAFIGTSCKKKGSLPFSDSDFVLVQGGTFWMGAQSENPTGDNYDPMAWKNESPVHQVTLSNFVIGKYEVTQTQWKDVMGKNPAYFQGNPDYLPVENISKTDVDKFLEKLNDLDDSYTYRLPTEAEWEYAACGGQVAMDAGTFYVYKFSGSEDIQKVAWFEGSLDTTIIGNGMRTTHWIGQKAANALGIYDMTGNVREWCSDWYEENYTVTANPINNPKGPGNGTLYVQRGGCWNYLDRGCRNTSRYNGSANSAYTLGIRLVREAK